jgi:outer membrane protein OmpA-like peptidoglycan-associated protein
MKHRNLYILAIITTFQTSLFAQYTEGGQMNLVPNPGFEEFDGFPIGWFYKGQDFDDLVKYWHSPTTASPDVYGQRVRVPVSWAEKGFGKQTPHSGQSMAGITVFGCANGKPHCREYVQIQLKEPLVEGQNYQFEIWVASLQNGLRINNLGAYFGTKNFKIAGEERLDVKPTVFASKIIEPKNNGWQKLSFKFKATAEADWLVIGNFFTDETTHYTSSIEGNSATGTTTHNFSYYYLDDISVRKIEPILPVPIKPDDLSRVSIEVGKTIMLKNIYFDTDKTELLPRSNVELNKLVNLLIDNPNMQIEIIGHTDDVGDLNYNLNLSRRRAAMVMDYLIHSGIPTKRLRSTGYGATQPMTPNISEEARSQNRRVEFRILKK